MEQKELGALWEKQGRKGNFYAGYIEIDGITKQVVMFPNDTGGNPKRPAFRILESRPMDAQPVVIDEEDIPF